MPAFVIAIGGIMAGGKSISRRIWDGPFATPPLEQPISVGWAMLKVLETLWRAVISIIAIVLIIAAVLYLHSQYDRPLSEQLSLDLRTGHPGCADTPTMPLRLQVTNGNSEAIGEWSLEIQAFERGHSTNIARTDFENNPMRMDAVLPPGEVVIFCVAKPDLTRDPEEPIGYSPRVNWASPLSGDYREPAAPPPPPISMTNGAATPTSNATAD